jgi:hypothetical protein
MAKNKEKQHYSSKMPWISKEMAPRKRIFRIDKIMKYSVPNGTDRC